MGSLPPDALVCPCAPLLAALYRRAQVQLQLGRHLEAVADCRAALALDPHNAQLSALREQIAAGCRAAAALATAPVAAPCSAPLQAAGAKPPALALPQQQPCASGAGSLQGSARLAAPAAAAAAEQQLPRSPDAFAGFDTPEAVRQQAKLCMVCMDADRGAPGGRPPAPAGGSAGLRAGKCQRRLQGLHASLPG